MAAIKLPFSGDKDKKRYTHIRQNPMLVIPRNLDVVEWGRVNGLCTPYTEEVRIVVEIALN